MSRNAEIEWLEIEDKVIEYTIKSKKHRTHLKYLERKNAAELLKRIYQMLLAGRKINDVHQIKLDNANRENTNGKYYQDKN